MSLRWKLLFPVLLVGLMTFLFLDSIWIPRYLETQKAEYLAEVDRHMDSVIEGLIPLMMASQLDIISENLGELQKKNRDWAQIVLKNDRDKQIYPLMTEKTVDLVDRPGLQTLVKKIDYLQQPVGQLTIQLNLSRWLGLRESQYYQLTVLLVSIILLLGVFWIAIVEAVVVRPMHTLSVAAKALSRREFRTLLPRTGQDEMGILVQSFALMREDLRVYQENLLAEIDERQKAEQALTAHQQHLEEIVAQRTADLLRAKEAAEAASVAKSTFLSNMSHELRTPMHAIMGMTDLALRKASDPKLRDQLGKVLLASQHLLRLINDILDISKIEADRLTLERTDFMLGEVLENSMSLIGPKASEKNLKVMVDLTPEVASQVLVGDPLRLGQIILNLTSNAIKFTEQGSVTLRARMVEDTPSGVLLRFEVQDTGIGISTEDQARLFTAFEQADGSMTRKYGGTGLGLAISKRLSQLMGGEIGVESHPGVGSTFWFTARLGKAARNAVSPAPTFSYETAETQIKAEHAGALILLVEDEPINQEVSRELLESLEIHVTLAGDGAQAVDLASKNRYDLILMDMQMPVLNGVDATRKIRALPGYADIPILAMTANAFDEDRAVCMDAGMNDHIAKPVDRAILVDALLKWLGKNTINL